MKSARTSAIVLRRTNFGEADRIIQFLTPEGRVSVLARGVRKQKSKLAGGIELFAVSDVVIRSGRGDLGTLTSARLVKFFRHIIEDYDRLQFGYEVLRLVRRASEMVDEPEWYNLVAEVLAGLDASTVDFRLAQGWFFLHYAELLGHGLGLHYDSSGQKLQPDQRYHYDVGEQSLRPSEKGELTSAHITLLRLMLTKSLAVLVKVGGVEDVLDEVLSVSKAHAAIN